MRPCHFGKEVRVIAFHVPIVPPKATSQGAGKRMMIITSKATGKQLPLFFKSDKAKAAEHDLLVLCAPYKPARPIEGPVRLQVDFVWPWRVSEPKKRISLGRVPHVSKPDLSNVIKMLEDCLTKLGFWKDDGQVADLHVTKAWGDQVGIYVAISPIQAANAVNVPNVNSPKFSAQSELFP